MTILISPHVHLDERGIAWIDDTNIKVLEVVLDYLTHGWSPEEIHLQHRHLSLAQIHAAFSYYYDHQKEIDNQIRQRQEEEERLRAQASGQQTRQTLEARRAQNANPII